MSKKQKCKLLTAKQFKTLSKVQDWKVFEIPKEEWKYIPGLSRIEDTIAVMGSANVSDPRLLNRIDAIAGFDQLVYEANPQIGEPDGNAYHYVIQQTSHSVYPYIMHGPFRVEAMVPHWFKADDLDEYKEQEKPEKKRTTDTGSSGQSQSR